MARPNRIVWGLLLVAAGVLYGLNALEITDIDVLFDGWWTLFLIVPCGIGIFTRRDKWGNLFGFLLGVYLLLSAQDVLDGSVARKLVWPALIVFFGIKLLWGGISGRKKRVIVIEGDGDDDFEEIHAAFSSTYADYSGKVFEGASLSSVFGGVKCDLRNAIIEKNCVLKVTSVFGGATVLVPPTVNVKVAANTVFGGISDRTVRTEGNTVTLTITGDCVFGSLKIE